MLAVECVNLVKRYGPIAVVDGVDFDANTSEIHAVVGANGAGKSTLLGMLSGRVAATSGTVRVFGTQPRSGRPRDSMRAGIATVYQELSILPHLSCYENVFVGQTLVQFGLTDKRAMVKRFGELAAELEVDVSPTARAGDLSVAGAQTLEIMRAVQANAKVLLFDEPTAALSQHERSTLLALMTRLRRGGKCIVFVTHNIDEVLEVSDRVTVMRNAHKVDVRPGSEWTKPALIEAMIGEEVRRPSTSVNQSGTDEALRVDDLNVPNAISNVSFRLMKGEVVGLAGLVGAGRSTILRSIAGAEPDAKGSITIGGERRRWPRSVRQARRSGIYLVPEDRKNEGLVLSMTVPDNVTMADLGRVSVGPFVSRRRQMAEATRLLHKLQLSRPVGWYPAGNLSGGNQQKVVLAKALHSDGAVMLIDEPTRGVDVGAKVQLLEAIRDIARSGKAVVVVSSEIEDILDISDRILVISSGRIVHEYDLAVARPSLTEVVARSLGVAR
jgi:ABC-type sugar transport system ATPase subunit